MRDSGPAGRLLLLMPILVAGIVWGALGRPAWSAPNAAALPADLDLVPRQAAGFLRLRGPELWSNELFQDLRYLVDKAGPEAWKTFEKNCTPRPANIDRLTVVMLTPQTLGQPFPSVDPEAVSALVVVTTKTPYNRLEIMQTLGFREKVYRRNLYYFNEDLWSGLVLIDERTFLIGSEDAVVQFFDMSKTREADGPLQAALLEASRRHPIVLGVNTQALARENVGQFLPQPVQPLLDAQSGILTVDLDKEIRLDLRLNYQKDEQAQAGEKAVRAVLELAVAGLASSINQGETELKKKSENPNVAHVPETFAMVIALGVLREIESQLKSVPIKRDGTVVRVPYEFKNVGGYNTTVMSVMGMSTGISLLGRNAMGRFRAVAESIGGERKNPHEEHLKVLGNALERYHEAKGSYPPAALVDKDGRPTLSWRVALLPYLGEDNLYKEFRLDEPWDSLHNKKLIKRLPKAFKAPHSWHKGRTHDLVFTGMNTVFEGKNGTRKADIDGKTILLVLTATEDNESIYWTKPADLEYVDSKPIPNLFGSYGDSCHILFANGTYRLLKKDTDEKVVRSLIKRKGPKEKLPDEKEN